MSPCLLLIKRGFATWTEVTTSMSIDDVANTLAFAELLDRAQKGTR